MDIIFLALLTFYIFFKLSQHLGKIDEEEKKNIQEKIALVKKMQKQAEEVILKQEKIVGSASTLTKQTVEDDEIIKNLDEKSQENLKNILRLCNITPSFFLHGAKSAFEMVIKAFATADLNILKDLLSDNIYNNFAAAINQRKAEGQVLTTNLIAIEKSEISSALLFENQASIVVKFISKQINYISNKNGEIITGKKDEISEINDVWTFKKDINSENPNWTISATAT